MRRPGISQPSLSFAGGRFWSCINDDNLGRALTVLEALLSKALDLSNLVTAVSVVDDDEHSEVRLCGCLVELNPGQSLRAITERSLP